MSLPQTMTYIAVQATGGPDVMRPATGPLPTPRPDEVLIRVRAAGVNRPDVQQRKGAYPPPPGASPILGLEAAGEVVQLGAEVTSWRVGDQVCALTNGGAYAGPASLRHRNACLGRPATTRFVRAPCRRRISPSGPICSSVATWSPVSLR